MYIYIIIIIIIIFTNMLDADIRIFQEPEKPRSPQT